MRRAVDWQIGHGDLARLLEIVADLVGDLVDLPFGLLQTGLGL
jgi:hypothetical protein